jgi:hypothetical protein
MIPKQNKKNNSIKNKNVLLVKYLTEGEWKNRKTLGMKKRVDL